LRGETARPYAGRRHRQAEGQRHAASFVAMSDTCLPRRSVPDDADVYRDRRNTSGAYAEGIGRGGRLDRVTTRRMVLLFEWSVKLKNRFIFMKYP
jgi:hypothetical protein